MAMKIELSPRYAVVGAYVDRGGRLVRVYPVPFVRITFGGEPTCESCGRPGEVQLDDGSWWCAPCDAAAERLGYDGEEENTRRSEHD